MDRDEGAVTQVLAIIVALPIFVGSIAALLLFSGDWDETPEDTMDAQGSVRSTNLADFLIGSAGIGWENGPEGVERIGFADASGHGLDIDHLGYLRGASYEADPTNGRVDYEEALASLGMPNGSGFHMRMTPMAIGDLDYTINLSHLRTAYVGDWVTPIGCPTIADVLGVGPQVDLAQDALNTTASAIVEKERATVSSLGVDFRDQVFIDDVGPCIKVQVGLFTLDLLVEVSLSEVDGDVYPDHKGYLESVLPGRLDKYQVLVIGSEVDQNSLTSNVIRDLIEDWVLDGGMLIVLGSDSQNLQWMQPLFSIGTSTLNGGSYVNDPSHPVLWEPNALDWTSYDNFGLGWNIKDTGAGGAYDKFIHVIQEDGEDVLAISREGAFGDGRIFLTTYRPGDIVLRQGLVEAIGFVENLVTYDDKAHLFLEYGPELPPDTAIHVAIRHSFVTDEDLGLVPVRLEILSWDP